MSQVRGIGIYEKGKHPCSVDGKPTRDYRAWYDMLRRCTCADYQTEYPSYIGCSVDARFLKFQEFMLWAEQQKGFSEVSRHLDKDFLVPGNKVYSPETCVFLPARINTLVGSCKAVRGEYPVGVNWHSHMECFVARSTIDGVRHTIGHFKTPDAAFVAYKDFKEMNIKRVAEECRGTIDERVYEALLKYEVQITD